MKKKTTVLFWGIALSGFLAAGCGEKGPRPESPAERNQLVIRMFSSMEKGDAASAAVQAEKLRMLDPGNVYFSWVVEQQQCNQAVEQAQKMLDCGDFDGAEALLNKTIQRFPLHRTLLPERDRVRQLRELHKAVSAFLTAGTLPEKERQLGIAEKMAVSWKNPALSAALAAQRKKLQTAQSAAKAAAKPAAVKPAAAKPAAAKPAAGK